MFSYSIGCTRRKRLIYIDPNIQTKNYLCTRELHEIVPKKKKSYMSYNIGITPKKTSQMKKKASWLDLPVTYKSNPWPELGQFIVNNLPDCFSELIDSIEIHPNLFNTIKKKKKIKSTIRIAKFPILILQDLVVTAWYFSNVYKPQICKSWWSSHRISQKKKKHILK